MTIKSRQKTPIQYGNITKHAVALRPTIEVTPVKIRVLAPQEPVYSYRPITPRNLVDQMVISLHSDIGRLLDRCEKMRLSGVRELLGQAMRTLAADNAPVFERHQKEQEELRASQKALRADLSHK